MHRFTCLLSVLLLLLLVGSAAAELRIVTFPCACTAEMVDQELPFIGCRKKQLFGVTLTPGTATDAEGRSWTLQELSALDGFALQTASLRFYATDRYGKQTEYRVGSGDALNVVEGSNLWDATEAVEGLIAGQADSFRLRPIQATSQRGFYLDTTRGISLTIAFTVTESLPLFAGERISESLLADAALQMLEDGNPFIERYDEIADSLLDARFPLGVPYYYGGTNVEKILHRFQPQQPTNYYKANRLYLCGFDCAGYTHWIYEEAGLTAHPRISTILNSRDHVFPLPTDDTTTWAGRLRIGDLIAVSHGATHIMMYLGTLRQFGYTETDAGEAAALLDAPLVIHCGGNPFYYERYKAWIAEQNYTGVYPPDGGVTVSVVLPEAASAPNQYQTSWGRTFGWYDLDGTPLTVFPLNDCTRLAWYTETEG